MTKATGRGYGLDMASPVRHLRTMIDAAPSGAVSIREIARTFDTALSADFARVKHHEKVKTDDEAREWLLLEGARMMKRWVEIEPDADGDWTVRCKPGMTTDDWRFHKGPVTPNFDENPVLKDPFRPFTEFPDMLHALKDDDKKELVESFETFGWVPQLPAIKDERGVVLAGHRRLAVAKELGIEPKIETVHFGSDDAADAKRLAVALASNLGSKPLTPTNRRYIAERLYGEQKWSMERIAELLKVSQPTITRDLAGIIHVNNSKRGRPRSGPPKSDQAKHREAIYRQAYEAGESAKVAAQRAGAKQDRSAHLAFQRWREADQAAAKAKALVGHHVPPKPPDREPCPHCHGLGYIIKEQETND